MEQSNNKFSGLTIFAFVSLLLAGCFYLGFLFISKIDKLEVSQLENSTEQKNQTDLNEKLNSNIDSLVIKLSELDEKIQNNNTEIKNCENENKKQIDENLIQDLLEMETKVGEEFSQILPQFNQVLKKNNKLTGNNEVLEKFLKLFKSQISIEKLDKNNLTQEEKANLLNKYGTNLASDFEDKNYVKVYWKVKKLSKIIEIANIKDFLKNLKILINKRENLLNDLVNNYIENNLKKE